MLLTALWLYIGCGYSILDTQALQFFKYLFVTEALHNMLSRCRYREP